MLRTTFFRKFIITFAITFVLVSSIAVGAYATMRTWVTAPEIPTQQAVTIHIEQPTTTQTNTSTIDVEDDAEPEPDFDGVLPVVEALMDRKPYFFTFLIFGLDKSMQADAIMVGSIDAVANEINVISIPRDTLVDVNRRVRKPSNAYASGRFGGRDHASGVNQLKVEVSRLTGIRPDFYVQLDFEAFERVVDTIGGVSVNIPFHMRYTDPHQDLMIDLPAGEQLLSGEQALHFARFRQSDRGFTAITDYQRMENQQYLLTALFRELISPMTILRFPEFLRIYSDHVNTDLEYRNMAWFASRFTSGPGFNISNFNTYTLPIRGTSGAPYWYELPDRNGILELVNRTINPFQQDIVAGMLRIIDA